jgi:hypothetical protein
MQRVNSLLVFKFPQMCTYVEVILYCPFVLWHLMTGCEIETIVLSIYHVHSCRISSTLLKIEEFLCDSSFSNFPHFFRWMLSLENLLLPSRSCPTIIQKQVFLLPFTCQVAQLITSLYIGWHALITWHLILICNVILFSVIVNLMSIVNLLNCISFYSLQILESTCHTVISSLT